MLLSNKCTLHIVTVPSLPVNQNVAQLLKVFGPDPGLEGGNGH